MNSGVLILIILLVLLLLAGLGVGLYFALRKKPTKKPVIGPTGPFQTIVPVNGTTAPTGPFQPLPVNGATGAFAYGTTSSLSNIWTVFPQTSQSASYLGLGPSESNKSCKEYLFSLGPATTLNGTIPNALIWQGDGKSVLAFSSFGAGSVISLIDPKTWNQLQTGVFGITWEFNDTEKTWCSAVAPTTSTKLCMQKIGNGIRMSPLPGNFASSPDPSFQWTKSPLNSNLICKR